MAKGKGGFIGQDGLNAPDAPTGVSGTAGDTQVTVSWTAPSDVGGSAITGYNVQASDGTNFQYSYDITAASYDSKSYNVSSQASVPRSAILSTDGTKMYVLDYNGIIYQYSLSTAYDVSTASYDSVSLNISGVEANAQNIIISPDGLNLYFVGFANDRLYQYTMSTAFDLSTASSASKSLSFSSQDGIPYGVAFNNDGTKLFMVGGINDYAYQYSLSTAYDVSTGSYDSISFDLTSQEGSPYDVAFNADGTSMFVVGSEQDTVFEYTLSTGFDLSTASYSNNSFSVTSQDSSPQGLTFSSDGAKMYITGNTTDTIYQYSVGQVDYPTASPVTITGLTNGTSYTFNVWAINAFGWSVASDASGGVSPIEARIGLFLGNYTVESVNIASTGNASSFGTLTNGGRAGCGAWGSDTRAFVGGGNYNGTAATDTLTYASGGASTNFGDMAEQRYKYAALSNSTRGVAVGGLDNTATATDTMQYTSIASTGSWASFGTFTNTRQELGSGGGSSTRGLYFSGDQADSPYYTRTIDYITIATTGSVTNFGNISAFTSSGGAGASSSTRSVMGLGYRTDTFTQVNNIEYVTIASTGNGSDFGDLTQARSSQAATSSSVRAIWMGGNTSGGDQNTIDYITIASTGNATDFGDLSGGSSLRAATSDSHGGLS